jgi:uncharacterized lipoprotein YmbA
MKIVLLSLILSTLVMAGCSSSPTTTHYYLLNKPPALSQNTTKLESKSESKNSQSTKAIITVQVKLADYLNQPFVVMQQGTHKIHYSSFHLWAEPLLLSVQKALLSDLNLNNIEIKFINEALNKSNVHSTNLTVEVDYFHIGKDSRVILSGQYYWQKNNELLVNIPKQFLFHQQLKSDGYDGAISQQRNLITQLAESITIELKRNK